TKEKELMELSKAVNESRSKMDVAQSELDIYLSQHKFALDQLNQAKETLATNIDTLKERKATIKDMEIKIPQCEQELLKFFILLLMIFLLEIIGGILFCVYRNQIDTYVRDDLKEGLWLFETDGNIGLTNAWSIIQTDFGCCGVSNYTDWFEAFNMTQVPDSCCQEYSVSCGLHSPDTWWKD
ncbi:tetraspanin-4-like, partial [Chiloscyllium plagiosum]|uniref:tetraspanin-4-like n=1 Tax=Chiloscyllium plagiosum TaxID=36176 RepID=UPI001CB7B914